MKQHLNVDDLHTVSGGQWDGSGIKTASVLTPGGELADLDSVVQSEQERTAFTVPLKLCL